MKVERRRELEVDKIECLSLEISPQKSKSFLVGILYMHPNESINWNEKFEMFIDKILETEKEFYLLGDFNRDLLNEQIKKSMVRIFRTIWPNSKSHTIYTKICYFRNSYRSHLLQY